MKAMAEKTGDAEAAAKYSEVLERGKVGEISDYWWILIFLQVSYSQQLWNGKYFSYDSRLFDEHSMEALMPIVSMGKLRAKPTSSRAICISRSAGCRHTSRPKQVAFVAIISVIDMHYF